MTPVEEAGYLIGQQFILIEEDPSYSGWAKGTKVTLHRDDRTNIPAFKNADGDVAYVPLRKLTPVASTGVKFAATERTVKTTTIVVDRELTAAEQAEITAIIVKGNK